MVDDHRYKAYLSYSHEDAHWASWLHRSLEAYRVPRALRGSREDGAAIPARVAPIFRDRDDLSSASRLDEKLQTALAASEFLVVVCSPAAAASRWVNREIEEFRNLGRADRILCVIVDGDPGKAPGAGGCFPPALGDGATFEPLAADLRPGADGKSLARLKIVAGLLGLELDDLRRREVRRQRRRQALGAVVAVAVVALVGWSILSSIQQREARDKAENQAKLIVDLGADIKDEVSLQVQERIGRISMEYLADLDPLDLSPETSISVGQAIRSIGEAQQGQGQWAEAEQSFSEVRRLFEQLHEKHPDHPEILFELAQSEYSIAYLHYSLGNYPSAWPAARRYHQLAQVLRESNADNEKWQLEASYAATAVLAMQLTSGEVSSTELFPQADEAVRLAESLLRLEPDNPKYISNYSNTLAWSSDAKAAYCELEDALEGRKETLDYARLALDAEPSNNTLKTRVAYRLSGVANVSMDLGQIAATEAYRREATEILGELVREDPENMRWRSNFDWQRLLLTEALLGDDRLEEASGLLDELDTVSQETEPEQETRGDLESLSRHALLRAEWLVRTGSSAGLKEHLSRSLTVTGRLARMEGGLGVGGRDMYSRAAYLWRRHTPESLPVQLDVPLVEPRGAETRNCTDALSNARLAYVSGRDEIVSDEIRYLESRGFGPPSYGLFCATSGRCTVSQ